jgi:hypothetical protein
MMVAPTMSEPRLTSVPKMFTDAELPKISNIC